MIDIHGCSEVGFYYFKSTEVFDAEQHKNIHNTQIQRCIY